MNSAAKSYPAEILIPLCDRSLSTNVFSEDVPVISKHDVFSGEWFFEKTSAFYYNERARVYFKIKPAFVSYFALLRGLIEFTRSGYQQFTYQADQKVFGIDLPRDQFSELKKLLQNVHQLLLQEIQFKENLKKAIAFEERYKREMASIYHTGQMGSLYYRGTPPTLFSQV
jgi:hypothetical protein